MRAKLDIDHPDNQISNRFGSTHKPCPLEEYAEYGRYLEEKEKAARYQDEEIKRRIAEEQQLFD